MTSRATPDKRITFSQRIAPFASTSPRSFAWSGISTRILTATLLLGSAAPAGVAALFQSDQWALSGEAEAGAGYDSNLFARHGGTGDGYVLVDPTLSLQRLNSLTNLKADFSVKSFTYFTRTDLNCFDPLLKVRLRYPFDEEVEATQEFTAYATRRTEANATVGTRLRSDDYNAHWEGSFTPTGKLTVLTRTDLRRTDYLTAGFNTNDGASAGATVDFVSNERLQLGAGYDFVYERSRPDLAILSETQSAQHRYTIRGRGEFLPKVTGNFFLGAGHTTYRGSIDQSEWDFVAGASLVWQATERAQYALTLNRSTDFTPFGGAFIGSSLGLEWTQEISGGFKLTVGTDLADIGYRYGSNNQHFRSYRGYTQILYALTERLSASLRASYSNQNSDVFLANFNRGTVYASLTIKL